MKKRTDAQRATFMAADAYAQTMPTFSVNLLVRDVEVSVRFYRDVLGANVRYADPDFAALSIGSLEFMLHADHTYDSHPWYDALQSDAGRGLGAELRLHGLDPVAVEARALAAGAVIVQAAKVKAHGWHEVMVQDPDGYVWAVGMLTAPTG